jgi:hypothetical protein
MSEKLNPLLTRYEPKQLSRSSSWLLATRSVFQPFSYTTTPRRTELLYRTVRRDVNAPKQSAAIRDWKWLSLEYTSGICLELPATEENREKVHMSHDK